MENLKARQATVREGSNIWQKSARRSRTWSGPGIGDSQLQVFKGTLEKARIDEALDPSKMPNISTVKGLRLRRGFTESEIRLSGSSLVAGWVALAIVL